MKISTRGRYAVRLMIELAGAGKEEFTPLSVVSDKLEVSLKYLEQIASGLTKGGLLESSRGIKGEGGSQDKQIRNGLYIQRIEDA